MIKLDSNIIAINNKLSKFVGMKNLGATCYINSLV
jgi:hypothetical protein